MYTSYIRRLEGKLPEAEYKNLYAKFKNLELVAKIWAALTDVFYNYAKYFEYNDKAYEAKLYASVKKLDELHEMGKAALGDEFYGISGESLVGAGRFEQIPIFTGEIVKSFESEKAVYEATLAENNYDFIIAGGACEGHKLMKEVNFSDTYARDGEVYRIPGSAKGAEWSTIKAHGWFSYELNVRPNTENAIELTLGSYTDTLDVKVTLGEESTEIGEAISGKTVKTLVYNAKDEKTVRIRFDKISGNTPKIYTVKVK